MIGEGCEVLEASEALLLLLGLRGFEGAGASAVARGSSWGADEGAAPSSPAMGEGAADGEEAAARRRALAMRL